MAKWTPGHLYDGRAFVPVAGTPVPLTNTSVFREEISTILITAEEDNTGSIIFGASTVSGSVATRRGGYLNPGDSVSINVTQAHFIYIDAEVSTDGVNWLAEAP